MAPRAKRILAVFRSAAMILIMAGVSSAHQGTDLWKESHGTEDAKYIHLGVNYKSLNTNEYYSPEQHLWMGDWSQVSADKYTFEWINWYDAGVLEWYSNTTTWVLKPDGGSVTSPGFTWGEWTFSKTGSYIDMDARYYEEETCYQDEFGQRHCTGPIPSSIFGLIFDGGG